MDGLIGVSLAVMQSTNVIKYNVYTLYDIGHSKSKMKSVMET